MDEVLIMIRELIIGQYDALEFSWDIQEAIARNYKDIVQINQDVATILNDDMVDIADTMEQGMEPEPFIQQVKVEYDRIMVILNE